MLRISRLTAFLILIIALLAGRAYATSYTVSNGDFETTPVNNTLPTGWVLVAGSAFVSRQMPWTSSGFCNITVPDRASNWFGCVGFAGPVASPLTSIGAGTGNLSWQVVGYVGVASNLYCGVEFFDGSTVSLGITEVSSPIAMTVGAWATYTCPAFSIPAAAGSFRIRLRHTANASVAFDDLQNVVADDTTSGGGTGGGGGGGTIDFSTMPGDFTNITDWESAVGLSQAVQDIQNELANFTCPVSLAGRISAVTDTVSSVVSVIGGIFGGGGAQVLQLIKILNNGKKMLKNGQELLCEATTQTEIMEAIFEGITIDKATGQIILDEPTASDPQAEDLADIYDDTIGAFPVGGDDTVTAVNKTNKLLVASALANAEAWDRALGGQRFDYETDRGPLITTTNIAANEPNLIYAEGDFDQNYIELDTRREAAGVAPAWDKHAALTASMADVPTSCLTPEAAPSGTGIALAWSTVRWNARQTFAGSDLGAMLCDFIAERNTPVTGDVCLFAGSGMSISIPGQSSAWQLVSPSGYCIAGPQAPSWTSGVWSIMPTLTMLMAAFAVLKLLI